VTENNFNLSTIKKVNRSFTTANLLPAQDGGGRGSSRCLQFRAVFERFGLINDDFVTVVYFYYPRT